jgi:hypothetical protein
MINICSYCETEDQNKQKKEKSSKVVSVSAQKKEQDAMKRSKRACLFPPTTTN